MTQSLLPEPSRVPPEPDADAQEAAARSQAKIAELDPLAAQFIDDLSGFASDHRGHAQAQRRLDAYFAWKAADTAQSNPAAAQTTADSLRKATWVLVACTAVLAVATVFLAYFTWQLAAEEGPDKVSLALRTARPCGLAPDSCWIRAM